MKLNNIAFGKDEELKEITVTMSIKEAAWIAKMTGSTNSVNSKLHHEIYHCLTGAFFNKFYDNGVADVIVTLPKIQDISLDE